MISGPESGKNCVERDWAAPPEPPDEPCDMGREVGKRKTLLDRRSAAGAFPNTDICVKGDELPVIRERLDHGKATRGRLLGDEPLPAKAKISRRVPQFRFRPRAPHTRTRCAHLLLEEDWITLYFR